MSLLWITAIGLSLACVLGWLVEIRTRNAGHADVIWAWGLTAAALFYLVMGDGALEARLAAGVLVLIWGVRLGSHVLHRVLTEPEDGRYQAMRERLGRHVHAFHLFFFLMQGLLAWLFSLPHWVISGASDSGLLWPLLGLSVGLMALAGEALADRQLARWRSDPANQGKTCRQGLWRYSRHPNYFFEWLHWFSYPLIAVGTPGAVWLWLAPVAMFLFLWFVTGIPYTEKQALKSRGEDYRHYQRTTSAFFPWRPGDDD